jgi:hypothetical protein
MIPPQAGRLFMGPIGTPDDQLTEVRFTSEPLVFEPVRELRQRIAFRYPSAGLEHERLVGAQVDTLALHGVNLAGPGLVVTSAEPVDDGDNLWIIAERWEDA